MSTSKESAHTAGIASRMAALVLRQPPLVAATADGVCCVSADHPGQLQFGILIRY
jgi:hypothetical protein